VSPSLRSPSARRAPAPADARRWLVWTTCAAAAVLTAVLSIVPLAAELMVLAAVVGRSRAVLVRLIASAGLLAMLVAWLAAPSLGVSYGRPEAARPGLMATTAGGMRFLAWDRPALLAAFVVALPVAWRGRRARARGAR